jgi:hypothetical protein
MLAARVAVQSSQRLLRDALAACLAIRPDVTVVGRVAEAADVLDFWRAEQPRRGDPRRGTPARRDGRSGPQNLVRRFPELNVIVIHRDYQANPETTSRLIIRYGTPFSCRFVCHIG